MAISLPCPVKVCDPLNFVNDFYFCLEVLNKSLVLSFFNTIIQKNNFNT